MGEALITRRGGGAAIKSVEVDHRSGGAVDDLSIYDYSISGNTITLSFHIDCFSHYDNEGTITIELK